MAARLPHPAALAGRIGIGQALHCSMHVRMHDTIGRILCLESLLENIQVFAQVFRSGAT